MQTLAERVMDSELRARVFSDRHLDALLVGSAQRRYNLVNRALKAREILRLARGVYILDPSLSGVHPHSFVVAQALRPGSFVSFESALAWHGFIPEAVRQVRCVAPGRRKKQFRVPAYGEFRFAPLPVTPGYLLAGVNREKLAGGVALIAKAIRALLDLACYLKVEPDELDEFIGGLRLDPDWLDRLTQENILRYREVYRHRRLHRIIEKLAEGVAT